MHATIILMKNKFVILSLLVTLFIALQPNAAAGQDSCATQNAITTLGEELKHLIAEETKRREAETSALKKALQVLAAHPDQEVVTGITRRQYIDLLQRIQDINKLFQKSGEELNDKIKKLEKHNRQTRSAPGDTIFFEQKAMQHYLIQVKDVLERLSPGTVPGKNLKSASAQKEKQEPGPR